MPAWNAGHAGDDAGDVGRGKAAISPGKWKAGGPPHDSIAFHPEPAFVTASELKTRQDGLSVAHWLEPSVPKRNLPVEPDSG